MTSPAPLVFFVYNRPDHTGLVLDSLRRNTMAEVTDFYIFSDAPKNEKAAEGVREVRELIHDFARTSPFKSTKIIEAEQNKGIRRSVIQGVTSVINEYGKVIALEDDLVCRENFLQYMNDALDHYEKNPKIWSISSHTKYFPALETMKEDVFFTYRHCSWGWAIWKDRWDTIDWEVRDYEEFLKDRNRQKRLARGGGDLKAMLINTMTGKSDSWALREQYAMSKTDMVTVYPRRSFTFNIGFDGSGVHCSASGNESMDDLSPLPYTFSDDIRIDRKINREFKHMEYPYLWERGIRKAKRILKLK